MRADYYLYNKCVACGLTFCKAACDQMIHVYLAVETVSEEKLVW